MSYCIDSGIWSSVFAVPAAVVDQHIKLCSPLSLKILLIMLRHPGEAFDAVRLSEMLNLSPADISDALNYWIGAGIVTDGGRRPETPPARDAAQAGPPAPPLSAAPIREERELDGGRRLITISARPRISREDIAELGRRDPTISLLLQEAQVILGAPLTPVESEILTALHSYYALPTDAVLMLLQYCVTAGHRSMSYLEKTAAAWLEKGICTHEQVEREILRLTRSNENEKKVLQAFGVYNRVLTTREKEFVARWFELGLDEQLIFLACERAVENTGKVSFPYADKILTAWKAKNVSTVRQAMEDMAAAGAKRAPAQNRSAQTGGDSSIDMDKLHALLHRQEED